MSNLLYLIPSTKTNPNNLYLDKLENSYFVDIIDKLGRNNSSSNEINYSLFSCNHDIINYADYETAKSLAIKIKTLFQLNLKSFIELDKTKLKDLTKLEEPRS